MIEFSTQILSCNRKKSDIVYFPTAMKTLDPNSRNMMKDYPGSSHSSGAGQSCFPKKFKARTAKRWPATHQENHIGTQQHSTIDPSLNLLKDLIYFEVVSANVKRRKLQVLGHSPGADVAVPSPAPNFTAILGGGAVTLCESPNFASGAT